MGLVNIFWQKYPEISRELTLVEDYIKKNITSRNKLLSQIVNELVEAGGKRIRPAYIVLSAKVGRYSSRKVIPVAGAIEILHTATLVHDDIIDCSKLRRGRVTVSEKYGNDMAVYTGDFLFTKAVLMLSKGVSVDKLGLVAKGIKIICEGEVDQYQCRYNVKTTILSYLKRISRKTAILFSASCALGAYLGKCNPSVTRSLSKFGFYYGMAFQIRDDLNDFLSDEKSSGKPVGKDIAEGLITLPVLYALNQSDIVKKAVIDVIEGKDGISPENVKKVIELTRQYDGIYKAQNLLDKYIQKALKELQGLPPSDYRTIFQDILFKLKI